MLEAQTWNLSGSTIYGEEQKKNLHMLHVPTTFGTFETFYMLRINIRNSEKYFFFDLARLQP